MCWVLECNICHAPTAIYLAQDQVHVMYLCLFSWVFLITFCVSGPGLSAKKNNSESLCTRHHLKSARNCHRRDTWTHLRRKMNKESVHRRTYIVRNIERNSCGVLSFPLSPRHHLSFLRLLSFRFLCSVMNRLVLVNGFDRCSFHRAQWHSRSSQT